MKYTQKMVNRVKPDENGIRHFPAYSKFEAGIIFPARCSFGKWCSFGEGCEADSIYWDKMYIPVNLAVSGRIYPTDNSRPYWQERFKKFFPIGDNDCYDDILRKGIKHKSKILKSKQWTSTELWIIHSWLGGE